MEKWFKYKFKYHSKYYTQRCVQSILYFLEYNLNMIIKTHQKVLQKHIMILTSKQNELFYLYNIKINKLQNRIKWEIQLILAITTSPITCTV